MRDGKRLGKLIWKDNNYFRKQRFRRKKLTLGEANERLHRYFPNMDILTYRGCANKALVHCRDCENTFETKSNISIYMYGYAVRCSSCVMNEYLERCKMILESKNFTVINLVYLKSYRGCREINIVARCKTCGCKLIKTKREFEQLVSCPECRRKSIIDKYNRLLENLNMYVTDYRYDEENIMWFNCVCNNCGDIKERRQDKLSKLKSCPSCNDIATISKAKDCYTNSGFKFIRQIIYKPKFAGNEGMQRKEECVHLFCGNQTVKYSYTLGSTIMCKKCKGKVVMGKSKDHNKHLVQEKLAMLKNVQAFKNAWLSQVPDALQKLDEGFAKTILIHIDGWINNYEEIVNTYPNGDLGTVIENNPLYKQVEDTFYPIMEKFGFKR